MKKLFTTTFAFALALGVFAQEKSVSNVSEAFNVKIDKFYSMDKQNDTIVVGPTVRGACSDTIGFAYIWGQEEGWLSGTNSFQDKEVAQRLSFTGNGEVIGIVAAMLGRAGATPGTITAKVYTGTNAPTTVAGTSQPVPVAQIPANGGSVPFLFATPVAVTGNFFGSIQILSGQPGDTAVVLSTRIGCGAADSYVLESDNTWAAFSSYQATLDLGIFAIVVTKSSGVTEFVGKDLNTIAFPNPANGYTNINYNLKDNGNVTIKVYDINGRVVLNHNDGFKAAGEYNTVLDLNTLKAGSYIYTIETNSVQAVGKLMVK